MTMEKNCRRGTNAPSIEGRPKGVVRPCGRDEVRRPDMNREEAVVTAGLYEGIEMGYPPLIFWCCWQPSGGWNKHHMLPGVNQRENKEVKGEQ